jgi:4-amino-4-deoxy-L-arabinose transferase-like glycosyltransferase
MTRQMRRDLLLLGLWGLAFQALWLIRLEHPSYFDAYYYTTNAQRLAGGHGFSEEIIWQYLDDPAGLPHTSHTYWMPLPSMVGATGYRLFGSFRGAQLPFWLLAGLLPVLGYVISWRLSGERWQAITAALLVAAGGYYAGLWVQPATFVIFGWIGGSFLLLLTLAQEQVRLRLWLLAGLLAGLAHLARADGLLLLPVAGLVWLWWWRAQRPALLMVLGAGALVVAGYLAVMGPWFWHSYRATGAALSTVGTQTIFLTDYNDVFAYRRQFDLDNYLAWGWSNILRSKLWAIWIGVQTFVAVTGLTAFTFLVVVGWLARWRRPSTRRFLLPATLYTLLLYGTMTLIFTFPGARGSLLHSSTALWPWSMALVPVGVAATIDWIAARRRSWRPRQARRIFAVAFVIMAYAITFAVAAGRPLGHEEAAVYRDVQTRLPGDAVVVTGNPPGFYYHTGVPALALPYEEPAVLLQIARRYDADYLLLDHNSPARLAEPITSPGGYPGITMLQDYGDGYRLFQLERAP